jgi:hypothetical protein
MVTFLNLTVAQHRTGTPAGFRAIPLIRRFEITPRWGLNRRRSGPRLGSKSLRYLNTLIEFGG